MSLRPEDISRFSVVIAILLAITALWGWLLDIVLLRTFLPGAPQTTPLTAVIILLLGLYILSIKLNNIIFRRVGNFLLATCTFILILTGFQYLFDWSPSIELILFRDQLLEIFSNYPGRPSPHTIITGIFLAFGFYISDLNFRSQRSLLTVIKIASWSIPWMALIGYFYSVRLLYGMTEAPKIGMSPVTAISYLFLVTSFLFDKKDSGLIKVLYSKSHGGTLIRSLLPIAIIFPFVITIVGDQLQKLTSISFDWGLAGLVITLLTIIGSYSIYDFEQKERKTFYELQRAESHLKLVIDNMQDGLCICKIIRRGTAASLDWKVIEINPVFEKILGYKRSELVGKLFTEVATDPEMIAFFKEKVSNMLKTGNINKFTIPIEKTSSWVEFNLYEIPGDEFVIMVSDVTEEIQLKEELTNQNNLLKLKNEEVENFAYIASHDLQEPLGTINNMMSMMRDDHADKVRPLTRYFDFMERSLVRMRDLISGLLDYSRLGKEKTLKKINLNTLIVDLKQDLGNKIEESGCDIYVSRLPAINAFEIEIRLLFQNLLSNAIKFSKPESHPMIDINYTESENDWQFSIKDNGIGIKEVNKDKIFEIFQRLNAEEAYEGTGIGLAHCKKIVELHHGQIWVESDFGKGSTFYFTISKHLGNERKKA